MAPQLVESPEARRALWLLFPEHTTSAASWSTAIIGAALLGYLSLQVKEYRRFYHQSVASRDSRQSEAIFRWIRWINLMVFSFVGLSVLYGATPSAYHLAVKPLLYLPVYGIFGYFVLYPDVVKALPFNHIIQHSPKPTTEKDLTQELRQRELYLDPELSVFRAALEFEMSPKYFSAEVKRQTNLNFSEWVNQARVERAKELLASGALERQTLEAVGQASGFSSRSSFYRAFTAMEGVSPGVWAKTYT
jgi:AraC-like DNA-binding protein